MFHSHTNPLLPYCPVPHQNSPLACPSPRFHGVVFRPLLRPSVPPARVHLTLLKSAEINYDLTWTNAHPSSIFGITYTPALLHGSRRYSAHVINQILRRESWQAALMALTQTCLIEFPLVTERLPTIRKIKKDSKNGGMNRMVCESSVATVTLRKYDASLLHPWLSLLNGPDTPLCIS